MRREFLVPEPSPALAVDSAGFEHHSFGAEGAAGARQAQVAPAGAGRFSRRPCSGGPAGGGGVENPGAGHGEYGERFGHGFRQEGLNSFAGVVKFTEREPNITAKPVIRALGVDRASQQVWATIGDMLLRFDRDGNLLDTYRVATTAGRRAAARGNFGGARSHPAGFRSRRDLRICPPRQTANSQQAIPQSRACVAVIVRAQIPATVTPGIFSHHFFAPLRHTPQVWAITTIRSWMLSR